MALGVNQTYKNYYTVRLGTLTTKHEIQSNRILMFTNEINDLAQKINFFENQKVLTLATPSGENLAINAKYFDLPDNFDINNQDTWSDPKYTTPCQKQLFIYRKVEKSEFDTAKLSDPTSVEQFNSDYYIKIPYVDNTASKHHTFDAGYSPNQYQKEITDSRTLSNKITTGEFTFVFRDDTGVNQKLSYKDLVFISEQQDKTAYQEQIQLLEGEKNSIQEHEKKVQSELNTTETEIQALQSMMESTEKVLNKNTETFKWGA